MSTVRIKSEIDIANVVQSNVTWLGGMWLSNRKRGLRDGELVAGMLVLVGRVGRSTDMRMDELTCRQAGR